MNTETTNQENENLSPQEPSASSQGFFVHESEDERLLRDILRPPMEKLMLFTQMIRRKECLSRENA